MDHCILLQRLSDKFGTWEKAPEWITSYLDNLKQLVVVEGVHSDQQELDYNVSQGLVLGSVLFRDYGSPIGNIFRRHDIQFHVYTDDTQMYISFHPDDQEETLERLEACLQEVHFLMAQNYLKLTYE